MCSGAKLDLELARKGNVPMQTFSRRLVLERFHKKVGFRENISMRYGLLKVCFFRQCYPSRLTFLYQIDDVVFGLTLLSIFACGMQGRQYIERPTSRQIQMA